MEETPQNLASLLYVLDLHANQLQGKILHLPPLGVYLDYSNNNFSFFIPDSVGDDLTVASFFSVSNNKFRGNIPQSICKATNLLVLDLSRNSLSGNIPECVTKMAETLAVLNLRGNKLRGIIPDAFPANCSLQTLDLNGNSLKGKVPHSLASCGNLEVLDLGNNKITDVFPCHLKCISKLHVLVLRSNKLAGPIDCQNYNGAWPMLQILDLASNRFNGTPPGDIVTSWEAMMVHEDEATSEIKHLQFEVFQLSRWYYQDAITITIKGLELELEKILTIFTSVDLSCNNFMGPIPEAMGELKALYLLNISHNTLSGAIPSSLGNLRQLESLDLSSNNLSGRIPGQLASLNFLSFLNLSNNRLQGEIPISTQLQTFTEASFENNSGLCGPPLRRGCVRKSESPTATGDSNSDSSDEETWSFMISMAIGLVFGYNIVLAPLFVWRRWRVWCFKQVDGLIFWLFPPRMDKRNHRRRRANRI